MSHTRNFVSFQFPLFIMAGIICLFSMACTKTPDVRLSMCQDLAVLLLNSPEGFEWQEHTPIMKGLDDLEMLVSYSIRQTNGQILHDKASCFYQYEQDEIGAETFNTPTSAYSSYPHKMIFKGTEVDQQQLIKMINEVMMHQGKKAIFKAKEKVKEGIEKIN